MRKLNLTGIDNMWEENDYDVMEDIKFYIKDHNIDLDKKDQFITAFDECSIG